MSTPQARQVPHTGRSIEKDIVIAADPGRVYEAWADPALIASWFVQRAVGRAEEGARVTWIWDTFGLEEEQEVLEAEPGRRLVLRSEGQAGGAQVVEVTLEAEARGTRLCLVHSGFAAGPGDPTYDGTDSGWTIALALLRYWMENHFGRPKGELMVLRKVPGSCARVGPLFDTEQGRARWLAAPAGASLEGETLAQAGPELARTWQDGGGTIELKAFAWNADECHVGVRVVSWVAAQEALSAMLPDFEAAVERLAALLA